MINKKEIVAMLLAGGQGIRLFALTQKKAKPAVSYGGKYKIIDFPLSNCTNSGIDTVGVLTQYEPLELNAYIGTGGFWDLDSLNGGAYVLPPYMKGETGNWYRGTADALYQNLDWLKQSHEPYVVIASGDGIYKMDYGKVLEYHIDKKADITVVCKEMPQGADLSRFGAVKADDNGRIIDFEEKPMATDAHMVSCGIYIIRRRQLIELIEKCAQEDRFDFVRDILIRYKNVKKIYSYKIDSYWNSISSVESYYETNMDFLKPEVRKHFLQDYPDIYSKVQDLPPAKYNAGSNVKNSLVASGCIINGTVENSILFKKVFVGNNCVIKNSIILNDVYLGDNTHIENCIVESRDTIRANSRYVGEDGVKVVIEKNDRYIM